MDRHTLSLARACVEMGLVGELSSARLRDELVLLLGETDVAGSVLRLGDIGLAAAIHPHLSADRETVELLRSDPFLLGKLNESAKLLSSPHSARTIARTLLSSSY